MLLHEHTRTHLLKDWMTTIYRWTYLIDGITATNTEIHRKGAAFWRCICVSVFFSVCLWKWEIERIDWENAPRVTTVRVRQWNILWIKAYIANCTELKKSLSNITCTDIANHKHTHTLNFQMMLSQNQEYNMLHFSHNLVHIRTW